MFMNTLLLHICCGPCATHVVDLLTREYEVTGFFYNPNIYPEEEHQKRLAAAREVAQRFAITLREGDYEPEVFFDAVRGLEDEPEGGERCTLCYRMRLAVAADHASAGGFSHLASTLTLGPQKKASVINPIGKQESERAGLVFVEGDWKKKDGFKRSCERSHAFGLYRQNYCGCLFSLRRNDPAA